MRSKIPISELLRLITLLFLFLICVYLTEKRKILQIFKENLKIRFEATSFLLI